MQTLLLAPKPHVHCARDGSTLLYLHPCSTSPTDDLVQTVRAMLLYVAAGQVFTSLDKAKAAAGDASSVKSFSDFFSAEEYASGGACDQASTTAACLAVSQASPPHAPPVAIEPPTKRPRYEAPKSTFQQPTFQQPTFQPPTLYQPPRPVGPTRFADVSDRIQSALATWTPHPDFAGSLQRSRADDGGGSGKHVSDPDQDMAIAAALRGESFLLTGSAGTGKSYVLKRIISQLRQVGKKVIVTASTGCAAVGIQGSTIHSALKLGLGTDAPTKLCARMREARNTAARMDIKRMDVLIIDEVSMIDKELFDLAEAVVRSCKCTNKSHPVRCKYCPLFGKAQVILCGDFFQLPPVAKGSEVKKFCFESRVFKKQIATVRRLRVVHRQSDWNFVGMLNELRRGVVTPSTQRVLAACRIPQRLRHEEVDERGEPVCFTKLFPYREQVRRENFASMSKLNTQSVVFQWSVVRSPKSNRYNVEMGVKNMKVEEAVQLRIGARVLCMKNIDVEGGICNGSPGKVVAFYPYDPTDKELDGGPSLVGTKKEDTIYREDGTTVSKFALRAREKQEQVIAERKRAASNDDEVIRIDVPATPESKEARRARMRKELELQRQQSKESAGGAGSSTSRVEIIQTKSAQKRAGKGGASGDPALEGNRIIQKAALHPQLNIPWMKMTPGVVPVVAFDNGVTRRIMPESWDIRSATGEVDARVTQIPLSLGYALSIHKSQGMTLARVQADLGGAFDSGQVYVALSRVSSIEGLRLPSFDARKVSAHQAVRDFENGLDQIGD